MLLLAPCNDIHTFGMKRNLDIAFIDSKGTVVKAATGVTPSRRMRVPGAAAVLERHACGLPWFQEGDQIQIGCAEIAQEERSGL